MLIFLRNLAVESDKTATFYMISLTNYFFYSDDSPLVVDNKTGLISLAGFPKGLKYQFSVQVSDNGYPILQSRASIQISVKSWNHNILSFVNNSYVVKVKESAKHGAFLTQMVAELKDYDGEITYEFIDGNLPHTKATNLFSIDPKDGKVHLTGSLDYEKISDYKLLVKARAQNVDSANVYVHVHVVNENDNSPKFDRDHITIHISENTPVQTRIIQVSARDADDPQGKILHYKINEGASNMFEIDASSGWVTVKEALDREDKTSHEMSIEVTDMMDDAGKSDRLKLNVVLVDSNDWRPVFDQDKYTFQMKENAIVSHLIGTLQSRDQDLNSTVRYYFSPLEKTNQQFAINPITGDITLLRRVQRAGDFLFEAIAYDGVNKNSVKVTIHVEDLNDKPPVCLNSFYTVDVKENWDLAKPLAHIQVENGDASDELMFMVQGEGVSKFKVNKKGMH